MKLYDGGRAPNPRRTRIFLAEKGIKVPLVPVDLGALEQMSASYSAINPVKRVPALVLDDGTVITESIACALSATSEEAPKSTDSTPSAVSRMKQVLNRPPEPKASPEPTTLSRMIRPTRSDGPQPRRASA